VLSTKSRANCISSRALERRGKALQNPLSRSMWVFNTKPMVLKCTAENEHAELGCKGRVKRMGLKSHVEVIAWTKQQALKIIQTKNKNKYRRKLLHCSPHCIISKKLWELLFFPKWQLIADLNKRSPGQQGDRRKDQGGDKEKTNQSSQGLRLLATPWPHALISSTNCRDWQHPSMLSATSP